MCNIHLKLNIWLNELTFDTFECRNQTLIELFKIDLSSKGLKKSNRHRQLDATLVCQYNIDFKMLQFSNVDSNIYELKICIIITMQNRNGSLLFKILVRFDCENYLGNKLLNRWLIIIFQI